MLGQKFYFNSMRNMVVGFGNLFNNIHIERTDNDSLTSKTFKIPLDYAPREHYISRLRDKTEGVANSLPRMSYEMVGVSYDSSRKLKTTGYRKSVIDTPEVQEVYRQLNPVPYNVSFNLNIFTRTIEDSLQIVEQILPFFTPDFNITLNEIPELGITRDIPIILEDVTQQDTWESAVGERRSVSWTLSFTSKMYVYPPIVQSKVILKAITELKQSSDLSFETMTHTVNPITAKKDEIWTIDEVIT